MDVSEFLGLELGHTLGVGLLNRYLELDVNEMKDANVSYRFEAARRLLEENPIYVFTRQLGILREFTSAIVQITSLASLTSRKSWPILVVTSMTPLVDRIIRLILYKEVYSRLSTSPVRIPKCRWPSME